LRRIFFTKQSVEKIRADKKCATTRLCKNKLQYELNENYQVWEGTRWKNKKTNIVIKFYKSKIWEYPTDFGRVLLDCPSLANEEGFDGYWGAYLRELARLNPAMRGGGKVLLNTLWFEVVQNE